MKKCLVLVLASLVGLTGLARTDVFDFKASIPLSEYKGKTIYKNFKKTSLKGEVYIEYDDDGSIVDPVEVVLRGKFPDGNTEKEGTINEFTVSVYGKTKNRWQVYGICELEDMVFCIAGVNGKLSGTKVKVACGPCSEVECSYHNTLKSISGTLAGTAVVDGCDQCCGDTFTWLFNLCQDDMDPWDGDDAVTGKFTLRYNSKKSREASGN